MYLVCQHVCLSVPAPWSLFTLLLERIATLKNVLEAYDEAYCCTLKIKYFLWFFWHLQFLKHMPFNFLDFAQCGNDENDAGDGTMRDPFYALC